MRTLHGFMLLANLGVLAACGNSSTGGGTGTTGDAGPGTGGSGAGAGGASSSPDRAAQACGRITDASCAKMVECKVMQNGTQMTASLCQQIRAQATASCSTKNAAGIAASSDAEIDACVQSFEQVQCSDMCGQVPQDPAACQKISPTPNTTTFVCAP